MAYLYILTTIISISLIIINKYGDFSYLQFILKPVAYVVERYFGVPLVFNHELGYISDELKIIINRECSGINFLSITICMLVISYGNRFRNKMMFFIGIFLSSYIITIVANSSRIISAVLLAKLDLSKDFRYDALLHQSIGVIIYFIYLLAAYIGMSILIKKLRVKNGQII